MTARNLCTAGLAGMAVALIWTAAVAVYPALAAVAVAGWIGGVRCFTFAGAAALVLTWLGLTAGWAWLRRPSPVAALARWDARAGRQEMFTSAWCFAAVAEPDAGQRLHLARHAQAVLDAGKGR